MSLQTGGEVQWGRQALLEGKNEAALGYFYSAALRDPNYVMRPGGSPKQGVWIMLDDQSTLPAEFPKPGKPWNGRFPPIEKKISPGSIWATLAREGDRQRGLKEIEAGCAALTIF